MFNRTVLVSILAFSLALNVATALTLCFSLWKGQAQAAEIALGQKPMRKFLQEDLTLSGDRAAHLLKMVDQKRSGLQELRRALESARSEMMDLVSAPSVDWSAVSAKVEAMNRIQGEIRYETVRTIADISGSLSPEDRKRFGAYLQARACVCGPSGPGFGKGPFGDPKADR
jgi:Spy/CpxP family protein refolding chaperone